MKSNALAPIALLTIAATPAFAAHDLSAKFTNADEAKASVNADEAKITAALNQLDDLVDLGKPLQATIDELDQLIQRMPGPESMRARMSMYLDDLAARTRSTYVDHYDISVFRRDFAESRIIAFLGEFERMTKGRGLSIDQASGVLEGWIARARAFTDAPDPAEYRARFRAAAQQAINDARSVNRFTQSLEANWVKGQLADAVQTRARRKATASDTAADVTRIVELVRRSRRLSMPRSARL